MLYRFILPRPIEEVEEFCILQWHRAEGEPYSAGDLLVEVETQKSVLEVRTGAPGSLRRVLCREGDWRPFGSAIALVSDSPGEPLAEGTSDDYPTLEAVLDVG